MQIKVHAIQIICINGVSSTNYFLFLFFFDSATKHQAARQATILTL